MEMQFAIGDEVVLVKPAADDNEELRIGDKGIVVRVPYENDDPFDDLLDMIGVQWERHLENTGHSCNNACPYGYGWFVNPNEIQIINRSEAAPDVSEFL